MKYRCTRRNERSNRERLRARREESGGFESKRRGLPAVDVRDSIVSRDFHGDQDFAAALDQRRIARERRDHAAEELGAFVAQVSRMGVSWDRITAWSWLPYW